MNGCEKFAFIETAHFAAKYYVLMYLTTVVNSRRKADVEQLCADSMQNSSFEHSSSSPQCFTATGKLEIPHVLRGYARGPEPHCALLSCIGERYHGNRRYR